MSLLAPLFPAAATNAMFAAPAAAIASYRAWEKLPPPQELLVTLTPIIVAYCTERIALAVLPEPAELRNLIPMILTFQLTPVTPIPLFPTPPMVPEQWVPWPLSSNGSPSLLTKS